MNERHSTLVVVISAITVLGVLATPVAAIGVDAPGTDDVDGGQDTEQPTDDPGLSDVTGVLTGSTGGDDPSTAGTTGGGDEDENGDEDGDEDHDKDKDKDGDEDHDKDKDKDGDEDHDKDKDGDEDKGGPGDTNQQNQQSNEEDDPVDPNLGGGNSLTLALGSENLTLESPTLDGNQEGSNEQWDGDEHGDSSKQSQQSNSDDDGLDLDALSGNSIVVGLGSDDAASTDGGDTDGQSNENDQYDARSGDSTQQSQQSNSDDDGIDGALLNGNSLAVALGGNDTSAGDGGDTGTQSNDNDQGSDGCHGSDANQQSQQSNSDDDGLDLAAGNGNSGVLALGSDDTSAGDGGDTNTQSNDNWQTGGDCHGDGTQQSQQSNSDDDLVSAVLLNGNSLAGALASENTSAGDGGDTNTQYNRNSQEGSGDADQQSQADDGGNALVPLEGLNGESIAGGFSDTDTTAGDGGDANEGKNRNHQFTHCP